MRLRELGPPVALLHPQEMQTVENFSGFDNNSAEEVLRGYYDDAVVIDAAGVEYAVTEVLIQHGPWWTRLPLIGQGGVQVDLELSRVTEYSADDLKRRLLSFLKQHPDWHWAGEAPWRESEVLSRFAEAATTEDVVRSVGAYAVEEYTPLPPGRSSKVTDLRGHHG